MFCVCFFFSRKTTWDHFTRRYSYICTIEILFTESSTFNRSDSFTRNWLVMCKWIQWNSVFVLLIVISKVENISLISMSVWLIDMIHLKSIALMIENYRFSAICLHSKVSPLFLPFSFHSCATTSGISNILCVVNRQNLHASNHFGICNNTNAVN